MPYLKQGGLYSEKVDFRRFTTLDYNMESYVGIVGVGIISGWTIEHVDALNVQILPGKGMIKGYAAESPYEYKQRSEMVIPEREVEVIRTDPDQTPEEDLTESERAQYVSVIQAYDPTYNPVGPIENAYVKAVIPEQLSLFDNLDNYIYALRSSTKKPYPEPLLNYPSTPVDPPEVGDYPTYNDYLIAVAEYEAAQAEIAEYEWREDSENHFTSIQFSISLSPIYDTNRVLIGKVVTRNGNVRLIDVRDVDNLENMKGRIEAFAKAVLSGHQHGGSGPFDPPKVRLETDVRSAILTTQRISGVNTYTALSSNRTSVTGSHQHSYIVNSNGNGYTVDTLGSDKKHFHIITDYGVGANEYSAAYQIDEHSHVIPLEEYSEWTNDSKFNVYLNGENIGDETTIESSPSNGTFVLEQEVGLIYRTYSSSFDVTYTDTSGVSQTELYTFTLRTYSSLSFMLKLQLDFFAKYGDTVSILENADGTFDANNHPFIFTTDDGGLEELQPLIDQSIIADQVLFDVGDRFTYTPKAARNITIMVSEIAFNVPRYNVRIEILGNTEVTGVLREGNILYLNAAKIVVGQFEPERIPFIDHIGRMNEECLPYQQYLTSKDAIKYAVIPSNTDVNLDHSHEVFVSTELNGITQRLYVGEDPVYYGTGSDGQTDYLISHIHGISDGDVLEAESQGL
ncbi:MAG: hypothetical protein QF535_05495, partial [Anaerolineales bacterium]|nr:hypothetical protein [Anaerolineales bacterium]